MKIGVDFDNTIVCYDNVFYKVASERFLIPTHLSGSKNDIRNYLRKTGKEDIWTELQGYVYGACMEMAYPYQGVYDFFNACIENGIKTYIISHRTKYPFLGERYDLHNAAYRWLKAHNFIGKSGLIDEDKVFFELTADDKLKKIIETECDVFIDDLPEFLFKDGFPPTTKKILFDPANQFNEKKDFLRFTSWKEISDYLFG